MRQSGIVLIAVLMTVSASAQRGTLAPGGTLRAAYLATNPAQALKDPLSGQLGGVAIDLARELARQQMAQVAFVAVQTPQAVIDAVQAGKANIGFVAYNPERAGPVEFSRPYLLVQQTFLVREDSAIKSVRDIDQQSFRIGARAGDSIALYLARTLRRTPVVELTEAQTREAPAMLLASKLDAFGANRQRLTDLLRGTPGLRLLPDDLYGVEQAIIVPRGNEAALDAVNEFIDSARKSGFLENSIKRSGVVGIGVAP